MWRNCLKGTSGLWRGAEFTFFGGNRLANHDRNGYLKREPRFLLLTETGAGTARFAPLCTATSIRTMFYDLGPS